MKKLIIILALIIIAIFSVDAQEMVNPIDVLEGNWLCKVNSISPEPANDDWKTNCKTISYEPIMNRNGLKQVSHSENSEQDDMYYFFDAAKGKLYGMCVDANGYMWQTEMAVNKNGNFDTTTGGPIHDTSITMTNDMQMINDNELSFEHKEFKDGKEIMKVSGTFYRIPDDLD